MELNPERTAVIAVHCQGDIVSGDGAFAPFFHDQVVTRNVISKIGSLLGSARESGMTVIYTRVAFKPDFSDLNANSPLLKVVEQAGCLKDGTALADIVPELAPTATDVVITHQRVGGFVPELTAVLEDRGIDTLVFAGVATNASVESTARVAQTPATGSSSPRTPAPPPHRKLTRPASNPWVCSRRFPAPPTSRALQLPRPSERQHPAAGHLDSCCRALVSNPKD